MYDYKLLIYLNHINQIISNNHCILISFPIYNLIMMMNDFLILVKFYPTPQLNSEFKIELSLLHMAHSHYLIMKLMYCMLRILYQL